jgi:hypothetical protein
VSDDSGDPGDPSHDHGKDLPDRCIIILFARDASTGGSIMISAVPAYTLTWEFDFDPTTAGGVGAPQYAFGVRTDDDSWWFHFGVTPTAWERLGAGSSGEADQVFLYTVTGVEPDLSSITITLPTPAASTSYGVTWSCQGCSKIVGIDITSKTTTHFVAVATGNLTAGDVLAFSVATLT